MANYDSVHFHQNVCKGRLVNVFDDRITFSRILAGKNATPSPTWGSRHINSVCASVLSCYTPRQQFAELLHSECPFILMKPCLDSMFSKRCRCVLPIASKFSAYSRVGSASSTQCLQSWVTLHDQCKPSHSSTIFRFSPTSHTTQLSQSPKAEKNRMTRAGRKGKEMVLIRPLCGR